MPQQPIRRLQSALAAALLLAALPAGPALAGDLIFTHDGKCTGNTKASFPPAEGDYAASTAEIVEENVDKITYRLEGIPTLQSIDTARVKAIYHDPDSIPGELRKGNQALARDDFPGAREAFSKVSDPKWARAEASWLAAQSWLAEGDGAAAEKALAAFKAENPTSRFVAKATEARARALLQLGKVEDAKTELRQLVKIPGLGEEATFEADYGLAWIDEQVAAQKNDAAGIAAAQKLYDALIAKLGGKAQYEALLRRCQVGRARCMLASGKAPEARDVLEKMAADTKQRRALAGIYNALGTATLRAAPAGDKEAQKQALLHYLRVVILYGEEPGAEEDCAEAMYHAGFLFRELKALGPDYGQRAVREWRELVDRFPGSAWATRAKNALAGR